MASWKKTIASPFKKACTFFNHQQQQPTTINVKKTHMNQDDEGRNMMDLQLQGEVMACGYEDVQVMWSILDKSKPGPPSSTFNLAS